MLDDREMGKRKKKTTLDWKVPVCHTNINIYINVKIRKHIVIIIVLMSAMGHALIAGIRNFLFPLAILPSAVNSVDYSSFLVGWP